MWIMRLTGLGRREGLGSFLDSKKSLNILHASNHKLPTLHPERFWKKIISPASARDLYAFRGGCVTIHQVINRFISVLSGSNWPWKTTLGSFRGFQLTLLHLPGRASETAEW